MTGTRKPTSKEEVADFVVKELTPLGPVTAKKMFGGVGLFLDGVMFAKVAGDGTLSFRVDEPNRAAYEQLGSEQNQGSGKKKAMPYYQVPDQVVENSTTFIQWARTAHAVAIAHKK